MPKRSLSKATTKLKCSDLTPSVEWRFPVCQRACVCVRERERERERGRERGGERARETGGEFT